WNGHFLSQRRREVRAADLFLQLPEESDIDRDALIDRIPGPQQRSQSRALVIGGTSSMVDAVLLPKRKGRLAPFRLLGRLHIQVIVDRHGRMMLPRGPAA